jgi:hypothetical protein
MRYGYPLKVNADDGTCSQSRKLIQPLDKKSEVSKPKILKSSNTHNPEPNVTGFINALPGNSSVNTAQHATIEEAVFFVSAVTSQQLIVIMRRVFRRSDRRANRLAG